MGEHNVSRERDPAAIRSFTKQLLRDLRALERILRGGMIESGVRRIGAEQELFLVNGGWHPAPISLKMLEDLEGRCFTTEIGLFNLEINLPPLCLEPHVFSRLEQTLTTLIGEADQAAQKHGARVVLTGILPSLSNADLALKNLTPHPRYFALNEAVLATRGSNLRLRIEGTDEFHIEHDSVTLEMCNTSFQVHLQVGAEEFARFYNIAQAMLGPVLAAAVNSPLLFGKRLWAETRIALFLQSMDTRNATPHTRELSPRVRFGESWVRESVLELFEEDVSRFRVMLASEVEEDSLQTLDAGGVPQLRALQLHNSTVYRWNRPCFGVSNGKPHLRIECRALPAGPTVLDEVANTAFWIGLVSGGVHEYGDITQVMDFDDARGNFLAAARGGLHAGFTWTHGKTVPARQLLLEHLLPLARQGLAELGITEEADRYLEIIEERVDTGRTGAQGKRVPVKEVMERNPLSVSPETPTLEVIRLMREHRLSALPVLKHGKLVGIVSERDFLPMAAHLMEEKLREG